MSFLDEKIRKPEESSVSSTSYVFVQEMIGYLSITISCAPQQVKTSNLMDNPSVLFVEVEVTP